MEPIDPYTKEIKILVAGAVDSSKSTTIGVLTTGKLDDGEMYKIVDRHKHEQTSGKTSSVSMHYMIKTNNYKEDSKSENDYKNSKIISLCNLCGHQQYFKNTLYGMSGTYADYGMLLVNINRGITEMGIEHMNVLIHLDIPFFIVLTKLDLCQERDMYIKGHEQLHKILRRFKKKGVSLHVDKDYNITENYLPYTDVISHSTDIVPIFSSCNRTGKNIDIIKDFMFNLKQRPVWNLHSIKNNVYFITSVYNVKHVGLVVTGILKSQKSIKIGDQLYIGPYNGRFLPVKVRSIQNNIRQDIEELNNGDSGCICIKFIGKEALNKMQIYKGMILTDDDQKISENVTNQFTAKIVVLQHHTSIKSHYQSVIHMGTIKQSARLYCENEQILRTNDKAIVGFKFIHHAEYLEIGTRFFAREGNTRIAGEIIDVKLPSFALEMCKQDEEYAIYKLHKKMATKK
jgi:elongation factor 1-alpha